MNNLINYRVGFIRLVTLIIIIAILIYFLYEVI